MRAIWSGGADASACVHGFLGYQDRCDFAVPDLEAHLQRIDVRKVRLAPRDFIEIRKVLYSSANSDTNIRSKITGKNLELRYRPVSDIGAQSRWIAGIGIEIEFDGLLVRMIDSGRLRIL